jgi:hypothetical protein
MHKTQLIFPNNDPNKPLFDIEGAVIQYMNDNDLFLFKNNFTNIKQFEERLYPDSFKVDKIIRVDESLLEERSCQATTVAQQLDNISLLLQYVQFLQWDIEDHYDFCSTCDYDPGHYKQVAEKEQKQLSSKLNPLAQRYVNRLFELIHEQLSGIDALNVPQAFKDDYKSMLSQFKQSKDLRQSEEQLSYWKDAIPDDLLKKAFLLFRSDCIKALKN